VAAPPQQQRQETSKQRCRDDHTPTCLAGAPGAPDAVHIVLGCQWEGIVEHSLQEHTGGRDA
jgi:hypothetical protein